MIRITITHVRTSPDGSTTTTLDDEYLGTIDGLAARLAACRAALFVKDEGGRMKDEKDFDPSDFIPPASDFPEAIVIDTPYENPAMPFVKAVAEAFGSGETLDQFAERIFQEPDPPAPAPEPAGFTVSGVPRPPEPWTGRTFFAWVKRTPGALEFVQSYGAQHGYPRRILNWSALMCEQANAAFYADRLIA
jgi:hypothetical protein